MRRKRNLPNTLRRLFVFLEIGVAVFFVGSILIVFIMPRMSGAMKSISMGDVRIEIPRETYSIESETIKGDEIYLDKIQGTVEVKEPVDIDLYSSSTMAPYILLLAFYGSCLFFVCELFRRLFKHVSEGDAFAEPNIRLLHKIGVVIILMHIGGAFGTSWALYENRSMLEENLEAEGVTLLHEARIPDAGYGLRIEGIHIKLSNEFLGISKGKFMLRIYFVGIIGGLLLIGIGEAFRQGLVLKQENELTV